MRHWAFGNRHWALKHPMPVSDVWRLASGVSSPYAPFMAKAFFIDFLIQTIAIAAVILAYEFLFKGGAAEIPSSGGATGVGHAVGAVARRSGLDALAMGAAAALIVSLVRAASGRGR